MTREVRRPFQVDGKPFFPLGGQTHNSSGYSAAEMTRAWDALAAFDANLIEVPVYWEQVEPEEGRYVWDSVDALLQGCRQRGLRLVILWFATWKNGMMRYCPEWVKLDTERFRRVITPVGYPIGVLSSHCAATRDADARAFSALMAHLHAVDGDEGTVIAVQIENEPGILGSDRDYGPEAQAVYDAPVPAEIVDRMRAAPESAVHAAWQREGAPEAGSWGELYGRDGGDFLTAWSIARYVDAIAVAGRAEHNVPLYTNVWLGEQRGGIAGIGYPAGGAVGKTLDIWLWSAPHLDLIAPDIYTGDHDGYRKTCAIYGRPDNALFIPESGRGISNALNIWYALADHDAVGYALFGIEGMLDADGQVKPESQAAAASFRCAAAAIPLLLEYQGTDRIHAIVQQEFMSEAYIELGDWVALIQFADGPEGGYRRDHRHGRCTDDRGRGLLVQSGPNEFYLVGAGWNAVFRHVACAAATFSGWQAADHRASRLFDYLSIEEGHFDDDGQWVTTRRRNGDETSGGAWVSPEIGLVRVRLS